MIFVGLSIADAYLTQLVLAAGGVELNPLAEPFGSSMLARGLLAAAIVATISFVGKRHWLCPLNVLVLWVVVWNLWQYVAAQATPFI
jgi:hypothetical protein